MLRNKKNRRLLSYFLLVIILLSLVNPAYATEINTFESNQINVNHIQDSADKISAKLTNEFDSKEYVTYLIELTEQSDTMSISKNTHKKSLAKNETPRKAILDSRSAVVNSLRETSTRTQASLIKYLDVMKASGDVKSYKSFYIVNSMAITSTKDVMEKIAEHPEVAKILPNETLHLIDDEPNLSTNGVSIKDNNPQVDNKSMTSDEPTDPNIQWNINQIDAPKAWKMGIDGTGIVIGSLDTGVDYTAPAIKRKWRGFDENGKLSNPELSWYDPTPEHTNLPYDGRAHGTHTMGTMVGSEENGTHKIGVAPGAKWMSARIFTSNGNTTTEILLDAGEWMIAPKDAQGNLHPELAPDVINNSWGGGSGIDEFYRPMVQAWKAANIVPIFSAGNQNTPDKAGPGTVANPANYPESFAVGATDKNNQLADFSLRGPSPYGEVKPDVSAPGVGVLSSVSTGYMTMNGTSMAAPHVAGITALMLQANASLTVDEIENILKQTATPMTNGDYYSSPNNGYGYGMVNAYHAVQAIVSGLGTVSGKVTTLGDDIEKPVIDYTPIKLAFTNADIPLHVTVNDNISVHSVEAFVRKTGDEGWISIPLTQMSGDYKHGIYEGSIPSSLITTPGLDYYYRVTDYGNNEVTTGPDTITIMNGITPGYFQDFEQNFDGYSTEGVNNTWQWGEPTTGPNAAFSGKKVVATNLTATYNPNTKADFIFPTIDLTNSPQGAILSFKQWYDFARDTDNGAILISADSTNNEYTTLDMMTGTNGEWQSKFIDLRQYGGQLVHVKLELNSDDNGQNSGWFIDDISLDTDHTAPSAPSNVTGYANPLGKVTLTWDASKDDDVNYYKIYRSTTPGSDYEFWGATPDTTYEDFDTSAGSGPYYYVVTAQDFSENESGYSNEATINLVTNPKIIYSDNFDGPDDNGWTHSGTNDEWERGIPESGPGAAYSSPNVWGTDLDNNYADDSDSFLYSPVIDLANTLHPVVTFQHWYELEGSFWRGPVDEGDLEISTDGENWEFIDYFSSLTDGRTWSQPGYDLEGYKGQQVQFRFRLLSNGTNNYAGWYIDNFQVSDVNEETVDKIVTPLNSAKMANLSRISLDQYSHSTDVVLPKEKAIGNTIQGLPVQATVTILETGQSVITDARNGEFNLNSNPGQYTARAESYGYYSEEQSITINNHETTTVNFNLKPMSRGKIQGVITDQFTGKPVSNARVMVMEDARISPVWTDSDGTYTLDVLEGDYTLAVANPEYYDQRVNVTVTGGQSNTTDVELKPFIGLSGELGYDDGSIESTSPFDNAGTLMAVRMTPETSSVQVTGAKFLFHGTFPQPGGTEFKYAMYDASGPKGSPGKMVAGPFEGTALRNGEWTTVHFDSAIIAHGDFYIAFIQSKPYPYSPGLGEDTDGLDAGRSWINFDGGWRKAYGSEGNLMIRALIKDEVNAPVITSPANKTYTKESQVTVTGSSTANGSSMKLYNGTSLVGTGTVENGQFSIPATLHVGSNELTAVADVEGKDTQTSLPVKVIFDATAPVVTVFDPVNDYITNKDVVTVNGSVSDDNQGSLTINDQHVKINTDGTFSYPVVVTQGENTITIKATDLAENETIMTRNVKVNKNAPILNNITPAQDVQMRDGEKVHVSFDSQPNLTAGFRITLPISVNSMNADGIPMTETRSGHYEGSWTLQSGLNISNAVIVVYASDNLGNYAEEKAVGHLTVSNQPPYNPGGGGDTPTPPVPPNEEGQTENPQGTISMDTKNGEIKLTVDEKKMDKDLNDTTKQEIVLDVEPSKNEQSIHKYSAVLTSDTLSKFVKNHKALVFDTGKEKLSISSENIQGIIESANGDVSITVEETDSNTTTMNSSHLTSNVFNVSISVTSGQQTTTVSQFKAPVTLKIGVNENSYSDSRKVAAYYFNENTNTWEYMGGKIVGDT
ncbi:MAG TPA: S8 family serine peptidase, partial [Pseudoneobacillus sp.]|nr:S8 family serine peptidase [Pseudoneobacillus sp.]